MSTKRMYWFQIRNCTRSFLVSFCRQIPQFHRAVFRRSARQRFDLEEKVHQKRQQNSFLSPDEISCIEQRLNGCGEYSVESICVLSCCHRRCSASDKMSSPKLEHFYRKFLSNVCILSAGAIEANISKSELCILNEVAAHSA